MTCKSSLRLLSVGALGFAALTAPLTAEAATVSASLQAKLNKTNRKLAAGTLLVEAPVTVIIAFDTASGLQQSHLDLLASKGIVNLGARFPALGMVSAKLTSVQVASLVNEPSVRSLSANDRLYYNLHQARILCGVDKLRADATLTARNGGKIVDGAGDNPDLTSFKPQFSVVVIDSGIDTSSPDLRFDNVSSAAGIIPNTKVIQNVQIVTDSGTGGSAPLENQIENDSVGHGSHCSGIVGGDGTFSRTTPRAGTLNQFEDYSGVASGVKIIGCGSGAGLFVLSALGGFEYALANQVKYNVRITSNSYGSTGAFNPDDSLNIAIEKAYRANITNVFAAGNSGPGVDTISNSSKSPYVICVAAGTKEGGLASFSSRGKPAAERGGPNPLPKDSKGNAYNPDAFNLNAITAPGTGREFATNGPGTLGTPNANPNAKGLTSDIISTRSKVPGAAAGTNDQELPAPYQTVYTQISGTSMACPFIAGTCALLLDVDSTLTPDKFHPQANGRLGLKEIIQATATHTPGYDDFESGAGYVNVLAAVDFAFNSSKPYKPFTFRDPEDFNTQITTIRLDPPARPAGYPPSTVQAVGSAKDEDFTLPYKPESTPSDNRAQALAKAAQFPNGNAYAFNVVADPNTGKAPTIIDVRVAFGKDGAAAEAGGNALGLRLYAPDGTIFAASPALPVLDAPTRQVVVKNPQLGLWVLELRPIRGLAAIPISPPAGGALPDTTTGQIFRTNLTITDPQDITELSQTQLDAIRFALANRYLDTFSGGTLFKPTAKVTREDYLKTLALNTPLRQSLASTTPRFTDTTPDTSRFGEAASQRGSTLRDFDFTPGPTLALTGATNMGPTISVSRAQNAVALVRALGLDREAQALKGVTVQGTYNGQTYPISDTPVYDPAEPSANNQNGYLQLAINRGLLLPVPVTQSDLSIKLYAYPNKPFSRAEMAIMINNFRRIFGLGNSLDANELPTMNPPPNT